MAKNDENFTNEQSVGFGRRILVHIFENAFYLSLIGLGHILYNTHFGLNRGETFERFDYYSISVAVIILIDQICGPVLLGTTMARWICGYRIQKRQGGNPTFVMSLVRVLSLWLIETLSAGIVTLITCLIRKDKASPHEVFSQTRSVFPERRKKPPIVRAGLALLVLLFIGLVGFDVMIYAAYDIFVNPFKAELLKRGAGRYPETILNQESPQSGAFRFKRLELANSAGFRKVEACADKADPEGYYILTVNASKYHVFHYKYDFESRFPLKKSFLTNIFRIHLFREPLHDIVERTFHNSEIEFPLLTPWRNTVNFIASILYTIVTPAGKMLYAIKGRTCYALVDTPIKNEFKALQIYVFFENDWETYDIIIKQKDDASRQILSKLAEAIYINEKVTSDAGHYPFCNKVQAK